MKIGELRDVLNQAEEQAQWLREIAESQAMEDSVRYYSIPLATMNDTAEILDKLVRFIQDSEIN